MKKVVRLTESELIRFVKRVIQENEEETDKKLLSNFFTVENNFQYVNTKDGVDVYVLKNKRFDVMVGVKPSEQPNSIVLLFTFDIWMIDHTDIINSNRNVPACFFIFEAL